MNNQINVYLVIVISQLLTACVEKTGVVFDGQGSPIASALIWVGNHKGEIHETLSATDGSFEFSSFAGENIYITADKEGYAQHTVKASSKNRLVLTPDSSSDGDGDFLSDLEESRLATDPVNPDTDGDGIPDGIEARVIYPISLVSMQVDPLHKDLLVEVDWDARFPSTKITRAAIKIAKTSFSQAPVDNPNGKKGIHLIVDQGNLGGGSGQNYALDSARTDIFYHTRSKLSLEEYFGWGEIYGRTTEMRGAFSNFGAGEGIVEAMIWIHELGHNLGLQHGGNDEIICKPNYPSVMNYNPFLALTLHFSSGTLPELDEDNLDEIRGIGFGPIDWNKNGRFDREIVQADIDGYTPVNILQWMLDSIDLKPNSPDLENVFDPQRCIRNLQPQVHRDHDDWAVITQRLDNELSIVLSKVSLSKPVEFPSLPVITETENIVLESFPLDTIKKILPQ